MRRPRGLSLALTLLALGVIVVLGLGLATLGLQQLSRSRSLYADRQALYAAEGGVEAALRELRHDPSWTAGLPAEGPEEGSCTVEITNNFRGSTDLTTPEGGAVPPGTAWVLAAGRSGAASRDVGVLVKAGHGHFAHALGSAGTVSVAATTTVTGPLKADGAITSTATLTMLPRFGDGRVLGSGNLTLGANGKIVMDPTQAVRVRGDLSPGPPYTRVTGTAEVYEADATEATDPFVADGRITNGAQVLPNPDVALLLAPGTYVDHSGQTAVTGAFDLDGKVHYFPDGILFAASSSLSGRGTIVVGNGHTGDFRCALGSNTNRLAVNIVALDGIDGTTGGSRLVFRAGTFLAGLVYSHEDVTVEAAFRVDGSLYAYRSGAAQVSASDLCEVRQDDLAVYLPGFDDFLSPPTISVRSWRTL